MCKGGFKLTFYFTVLSVSLSLTVSELYGAKYYGCRKIYVVERQPSDVISKGMVLQYFYTGVVSADSALVRVAWL